MDFNFKDSLIDLGKRIEKYKEKITNEEMTKQAFILPFFELLGYDTRNPFEFHAEFTADIVGMKGEKVDYAILISDNPVILIEAKEWTNPLDVADKQLSRYFMTTTAKIGILTNGIVYKFFSDLEETNKMDPQPFLEINLLDLKDYHLPELKKFFKPNFDIDNILNSAEELKYSGLIKNLLKSNFDDPDDDFINYIIGRVYDGKRTQNVKDKFSPLVRKSVSELVNELVKNKLEGALKINQTEEPNLTTQESPLQEEILNDGIITTEEELEGLSIVKTLLHENIDPDRLSGHDTKTYFSIVLDQSPRKSIVRLYFNYKNKYASFSHLDESEQKITIDLPNGIKNLYGLKETLINSLKNVMNLKEEQK